MSAGWAQPTFSAGPRVSRSARFCFLWFPFLRQIDSQSQGLNAGPNRNVCTCDVGILTIWVEPAAGLFVAGETSHGFTPALRGVIQSS
jgi:hypothetical protein